MRNRNSWCHKIWRQNCLNWWSNIGWNKYQISQIGPSHWCQFYRRSTVIRSLNVFKTFRTRSQQLKLEPWKVESTQLPEGSYANYNFFNPIIYQSFNINFAVTVESIFIKRQEFNIDWVMVNRWLFFNATKCTKGHSASQVVQPGNENYMRNKHVELGNKFELKFGFATSFEIPFGVGLVKSSWISLCSYSSNFAVAWKLSSVRKERETPAGCCNPARIAGVAHLYSVPVATVYILVLLLFCVLHTTSVSTNTPTGFAIL